MFHTLQYRGKTVFLSHANRLLLTFPVPFVGLVSRTHCIINHASKPIIVALSLSVYIHINLCRLGLVLSCVQIFPFACSL